MQQSSFDSQSHAIQVYKFCTKWDLPAGNLFTQENESRAWSQLRARRVISKIRVLANSRNPCKLSLFRFHSSAWFSYFFSLLFRACYVASHPKASISFKVQFFLLHIKGLWSVNMNWVPDWIFNKTYTCCRDCIHFRLSVVSRITVFMVYLNANTVNSLYSRHCRDLELASSWARVRNGGSLFQWSFCNLFLPGI